MSGKVKKKFVQTGAPLYMSQFTMIMLILIVMCMIMCTLANKQEGATGMNGEGMGKVRQANALGIVIGSGVFRFGTSGKARTFAANPGEEESVAPQNPHIDLLKGEGGSGNTDLNAKDLEKSKYIFAKLKSSFPAKSSAMTAGIQNDIKDLGTGISMFDFDLTIKCFSAEFQDLERDSHLSYERGMKIVKELNKRFDIPLAKMTCIVYSDEAMISRDAPPPQAKETAGVQQETVFIMRIK